MPVCWEAVEKYRKYVKEILNGIELPFHYHKWELRYFGKNLL